MITHTHNSLLRAFRDVGVTTGDVLLVHSSLRKLGPVKGGADTVIDALLEAVGAEGTLAVPTHTFQVVSGIQPVFHQRLTPSHVGVLTNVFRLRPEAIRGLHPTHSVAAIGPRAAEFVAITPEYDTPYPPASPYGRLRDWGGKILIIGESLNRCTFFHGCEEWSGMPEIVSENIVPLTSITTDGEEIAISTRSRPINTWDQYPRLEPFLLEAGAMCIGQIGDCSLRLLDARSAAEWLITRLKQDPSIILPDSTTNP